MNGFDFLSAPAPEPMLLWIVLLPLCGAIINGFFSRGASKGMVSFVALATVATSFLMSLYCFVSLLPLGGGEDGAGEAGANARLMLDAWRWFSVDVGGTEVPVRVRFVMDHLSGIMAVMVSGIASLIHLYSTEYMGEDESYPRFMTYLNLFTASMLILVLGSNLPLMFVGWEGVGLCSYLLIGFWWTNPAYAAAGRKAFVVNRIGDFGVLIGTFILLAYTRTFEFSEINAAIEGVGLRSLDVGEGAIGVTIATAAALFLFIGCTGKSAQLPLYVWLPDAMAGPTPVSALIHAATMVTAGVYLCCRLSPVFMMSPTAMATIAVVGTLTALLGASIGLVQNQMKKILAYSTVSQLGFMFAAVGCGAFAGGFFHVFTHAFFKACLFLGAGSVMHAVHAHGDADIRYLGGMRKFMPKTYATFGISCLAIAGFPLTSGFFSKDDILFGALEAWHHWGSAEATAGFAWVGLFVFVGLALAAFLTATYMFRLFFLTFWGSFRGGHAPEAHGDHGGEHGHDHEVEPHESGDAVTIPLMVLAAGALLAGFLGLPHWMGLPNWWAHWLTGEGESVGAVARFMAHAAAEGEHAHEAPGWLGPAAMAVGSLVGLGGMGLAYAWYAHKDVLDEAKETMLLRAVLGVAAVALLVLIGVPLGQHTVALFGAPAVHSAPVVVSVLASLAVLSVGGFAVFAATRPQPALFQWAFDKWRVDEFYGHALLAPFRWMAVVAANIDRIAVDGLLTWVPAQLARLSGWGLSRLQTGALHTYTLGFTVGAAAFVWWFTSPHAALQTETAGTTVTFAADPGPGYEYRWDFDSDGTWDQEWSSAADATHDYGQTDAYFGVVAVLDANGAEDLEPTELELEESPTTLPLVGSPLEWFRAGDDGSTPAHPRPPTLRLDGGAVVLTANDAMVTGAGDPDDNQRYRLAPGDSARIGAFTVRIALRARATVQVRSVFGNLTRTHSDLTLNVPHTELEPVADAASGHR